MTVVDPGRTAARWTSILEQADVAAVPPVRIEVLDSTRDASPSSTLSRTSGGIPVHIVDNITDNPIGAERPLELRVKRWIDVTIAAAVLTLSAPLLATLALLLRIDSPGPALHRRRVLGRGGQTFDALKLRTMVCDGGAVLATRPDLQVRLDADHKLDDDPRITRCGRWLRRLSLDELPQLWNVLRGEMSLVGPRMISPPELERYGAQGKTLLTVQPGLTGLWQVSGRSNLSPSERVRLDLAYVEQRRLALDLQLLLRTIPAVVRCRGAR